MDRHSGRRWANRVALVSGGLLLSVIPITGAEAVELKGNGPSALAVGFGTAWVGTGDGELRPVDAESRRLGRSIRLNGDARSAAFSVKNIAVGFGSVWVTTGQAVLRKVNPRTHRVRESYRLGEGGWTPTLVEVGAGAVWVGDYERNRVFRVDPRSGRVTRSYRVDGRLVRIAAGPLGVWAITAPGSGPLTGPEGRRLLVRLDRDSWKPVRRYSCDGTLTVGSRWIWISDVCRGTVIRLDPRTRAVTTIDLGGEPWSIALGAGAAWVSSGRGLYRIAAERAHVTLASSHNNSLAAYDQRRVWYLDCWGCSRAHLRTIDTSDGTEIKPPISVAP
jgi:streptogramin lyase